MQEPLWKEASEALVELVCAIQSFAFFQNNCRCERLPRVKVAKSAEYDKDGVSVHTMNCADHVDNCNDAHRIKRWLQAVQLQGSTPTGMRLDDLLRPYVEACEEARAPANRPKPMVCTHSRQGLFQVTVFSDDEGERA